MSLITIREGNLSATVDTCGAAFHSIVLDGTEYLWQGDPKYWKDRDKNLFPYVGRMTDGSYLLGGKKYSMPIHGFCVGREFQVAVQSENAVTLSLKECEETLEMYPFPFQFDITYSISGHSILKSCRVKNTGTEEMFFGLGSHPGFQVPLGNEGKFEDWVMVFDEASFPIRIGFDPANYRLSGIDVPYRLENDTALPLRHDLFDKDAVVLSGTPRTVTLKSPGSSRSVKVSFPGMPFVGFWHKPETDAPYVCIEPWVSLPSHSAYMEDLARQEHIIHLPAGEEYVNDITIELT